MIIIYNTDSAYIQKRTVGLKRALHNKYMDYQRDSSSCTREKEKGLSTPSTRMTVSVAGDFTECLWITLTNFAYEFFNLRSVFRKLMLITF